MGLQGFERRLEGMVEGVFARVFRSGLKPIEIGRRLTREMDTNRSLDVRGRTLVPNAFTVHLSATDHERFAEIGDQLTRELGDAAREHARDEGYSFAGPVEVEMVVDDSFGPGELRIEGRMRQGAGGTGAGSLLLPGGGRYVLGQVPAVIGRTAECDVTLDDANVSRRHAEIRPEAEGFALVDLGSTNGSYVNGVRIDHRVLNHGDVLTFGNSRCTFEAS